MDTSKLNVEIYDRYVENYVDKFMDLDLYRDTFDYLLNSIAEGGAVLELGCGPGNVVRYMSSKRPDLRILGIDLSPRMIEVAAAVNPGAEFRLMDIRHAGELEGHFDAVVSAFSIPYLSSGDVAAVFAEMRRLTARKKGMIYVSFMEGPRERSGFERTSFTGTSEMYLNYYPRTDIEALMQKQGFVIQQIHAKDYPETDGTVTTELIYLAV
ncbi:MAG TPA: class I SAM-dependent methyltransferase [Flavisolibacter sp.]|nr:class I SAM-dependent methyltransferase [Flavisolibacter sp.]